MLQGEMNIRVGRCQPVRSYGQQLSTHGAEQEGEHVTSHIEKSEAFKGLVSPAVSPSSSSDCFDKDLLVETITATLY